MLNLSDNLTHLIQLGMLLAVMCVLIVFAPSIPAQVVLAAFAPAASFLLGAKLNQSATNAATSAADPAPQNGPAVKG